MPDDPDEPAEAQPEGDERQPEAEAVGDREVTARAGGPWSSQRDHRAEGRADARRPGEREDAPNTGAPSSPAAGSLLHPPLPLQPGNEAEEGQTEHDDEQPATISIVRRWSTAASPGAGDEHDEGDEDRP